MTIVTKEIEVLENQARLVETDARFCAGYGGVGAGKTLGAQFKMWGRLRSYPKAGHYVCAADYEQLRRGYFLDFRFLLEELLGWKESRDFRYRESPRPEIILLDSGARLRALSAEIAERIRSTQIQSLSVEEPQTWGPNAERVWHTLVGRLRHSVRSAREHPEMIIQAWMTFNPGGNPGVPVGSWLHKLITENWVEHGYPSWQFSLRDNYLLLDHATVIKNLEDNLPPSLWPVEIDGNFPTSGGGVYREFDMAVHAAPAPKGLPAVALREQAELLWGWDFNVGYQCSTLAQAYVQIPLIEYRADRTSFERLPVQNWQKRVFYFLDEITLPDAGVQDVLKEFLTRDGGRYAAHARKWGLIIYGDHNGGNRSQSASSSSAIRTHWELMKSTLAEHGIRPKFRVPPNPAEYDRVVRMNEQFRTGAGYGVLVDALRCPVLVKDWLTVRHKPNTNQIEKKNAPQEAARLTHASDSATYVIWAEHLKELELAGKARDIGWTMVR